MPIELKMPALSPTMEKGNLAQWLKNVGDRVKAGDIIAEIETDKATMEYEAEEDGVLAQILVSAGTQDVAVGTPIALIGSEREAFTPPTIPASSAEVLDKPALSVATPQAPQQSAMEERVGPLATPLARRIAEDQEISLQTITGSGAYGRILKRDVEGEQPAAQLETGATFLARIARQGHIDVSEARALIAKVLQTETAVTPAAPPTARTGVPESIPFEEVKLSAMRKVIAARLTASKQTVPHFYMTVDVELDALLALRKEINKADTTKISVNDFIIKALAKALMMTPEANVQYGDGVTLRRFGQADISVAVAVPDGLVTPVIRAADREPLSVISEEMKNLAEQARAGKLLPEDYQGGTFSLSNLGMYDIRQFDAVINPPQAGILAIGKGEQRAVVKDGGLVIATVMCATLSVDHRAVDGATGAQLLTAIKKLLEAPLTILL